MKMEKNILPFIELEDIASFNYPVYAHMKEKDGITIYETLEEHTNRCKYYFKRIFYQKELDCVVRRFSEALEFKNKKAVYRWMIKLLWQMIIFHDIGKCNPNFQRKKMKNNDDSIPESLKGLSGTEHSFLSSILYLDYFFDLLEKEEAFEKKEKKKMMVIIWEHAYIISRHHSDLESLNSYAECTDSPEKRELIHFLSDQNKFPKIQKQNEKNIFNVFKKHYSAKKNFEKEENIQKYFYYRLAYSLLVASDYHATTEFMQDMKKDDLADGLSIAEYEESYKNSDISKSIRNYEHTKYIEKDKYLESITDMNELRSELFLDAEKELNKHLDNELFFLEAPTGSGKSNTALQLSFHLMGEHGKKLFYIYPFNTLVEQNMKTLSELFKDKKLQDQIVVVNSLTPITVKENIKNEDSTNYYQEALLDRQFLNYPMILSTHVSFFNVLFGSKKEDIFGFYQLTDSVIVLDEIQSYRNYIWTEIITMLKYCASLMGMKIIIMSATFPNLEVLTDEKNQVVHLMQNRNLYFEHPIFKNRVKISYELLEDDKITYEKLLQHIIENKEKQQKILVEFIKKDSAYTFYQMLIESKEIECDVKCITGDDSIYEREKILNPIKSGEMKDLILVATQVIEAGVDIDMDVGYKNVSLLDSEEQFLGRINRSCKRKGKAYFFYIDSWEKIYQKDFRKNREFTLCERNMQQILENKHFYDYYNQVFKLLRKNLNENTDGKGIEDFWNNINKLNFSEIAKRMQLIDDNSWSMDIVLCRRLELEDGTVLDGEEVWNEYKNILEDSDMEYAKKQIKLSVARSNLKYFTYRIKKNSDLIYNDILGELRCIYDGEQYFENGKLNKKLLEQSGGVFIDI